MSARPSGEICESGGVFRLAIVCSHPIQYLAPWFAALAAEPQLDVTVLYGDDHGMRAGFEPGFQKTFGWDVDLSAGYRFEILRNQALRPGVDRFWGILSSELFTRLTPQRFDGVLIQGWNYALYPLALLAARRRGLPVLVRCESVQPKTGLKQMLLRRYLASCAAALAISTPNRRLLLHYGVPAERIFFSPYAVDGAHFRLGVGQRQAARRAWRLALRLDAEAATPILLFVGKLVPIKAPELLLEAFLALRRLGIFAHLVFCGDGPLRNSLEQAASAAGPFASDVSFLGFVNQAELPTLYAAADVLILPSLRETFGVVVAEAMHAGLPVVVADSVGCAEDLVRPAQTAPPAGLCFAAKDAAALLQCLRELCEGPQAQNRRAVLAAGARVRIAHWNYAAATHGLLQALTSLPAHLPILLQR